jgi:hypothetical protein
MMAGLHKTRIKIKVEDVLIRRGVTEEDSREVMTIKLATTSTRPFHTNSGTKKFEIGDVWLAAAPRLVWRPSNRGMDEAVMQIRRVDQSRGPKFRREAGAVEECSNLHRKSIVIYFDGTIL